MCRWQTFFRSMWKVWTVNDKAEIERLMDAGVDAVITNYPDVAVSCRNAK